MTLEPLLWLWCSISGRCFLEIHHRNSGRALGGARAEIAAWASRLGRAPPVARYSCSRTHRGGAFSCKRGTPCTHHQYSLTRCLATLSFPLSRCLLPVALSPAAARRLGKVRGSLLPSRGVGPRLWRRAQVAASYLLPAALSPAAGAWRSKRQPGPDASVEPPFSRRLDHPPQHSPVYGRVKGIGLVTSYLSLASFSLPLPKPNATAGAWRSKSRSRRLDPPRSKPPSSSCSCHSCRPPPPTRHPARSA